MAADNPRRQHEDTLTLVLLGNRAFAPLLGAAAAALWVSMALFAVIIIRATWHPAETA